MPSPTSFYLRAIGYYTLARAAQLARNRRLHARRDPAGEAYDSIRSTLLDRINEWDLDTFVTRDAGDHLAEDDWKFAAYHDGRIVPSIREPRRRLLAQLETAVRSYAPRTVAEVGCGAGRNLLYLKSKMPELRVTGFDLSPKSVEVARAAADRYGIEATFEVGDLLADDWPVGRADVVISVHALEQLPAGATEAARHMLDIADIAVVMFEPLPDLWRGVGGFANRYRNRYIGRLPKGAFDGLPITRKDLLPYGTALNRTTEIHMEPSGT